MRRGGIWRHIAVVALVLCGWPVPEAAAAPVAAAAASAAAWYQGLSVAAQFGVRLLATSLLAAGASALARPRGVRSTGGEVLHDLAAPTALPLWRTVYGAARATGTLAGFAVSGRTFVGVWIVNSRPSVGPFSLLLDERPVALAGDPFDFDGAGATAADAPFAGHLRVWIGRGDQTSCPAALAAEFPEHFHLSDAWQGRTVVWARIDGGRSETLRQRWPSMPPALKIDGRWTPVWDPRDAAQDPEDPLSWQWSANQALCTLDALRCNPIRPYQLGHLWIDQFCLGADVADQSVTTADGGVTPRYEVHGTLAWTEDAELEDQIAPLVIAGAAELVRGRGQLGLIPGAPQAPAMVLRDMIEAPVSYQRYARRDQLATQVSGTYTAPASAWERATLPSYEVAGAADEDGGLAQPFAPDLSMITDHRQGQRVQAILLRRRRMQRQITLTAPPEAVELIAGGWCDTAFAQLPAFDGRWQVVSVTPHLIEDDALPLRCDLTLREVSAALYDWDPEVDEQEVASLEWDAAVPGVDAPGPLSVSLDESHDRIAAGVVEPRFRAEIGASPSGSVTRYEWQSKLSTDPDWPAASTSFAEPLDASGVPLDVIAFYGPLLTQTGQMDLRIRANGGRGPSAWVAVTGLSRGIDLVGTSIAASGDGDTLVIDFQAPLNAAFGGVELRFSASASDVASADVIATYDDPPQGVPVTWEVSGQAGFVGRYWLVPTTATGTTGAVFGPVMLSFANPDD